MVDPSRFRKIEVRTRNHQIGYSHARYHYLKHKAEFEKLPGVIGMSVGKRYCGGRPTKEWAIRLHMASENHKRDLRANAGTLNLRRDYGGVPIDLVVWEFRNLLGTQSDGETIVAGTERATLGTTVQTGDNLVWLTVAHLFTSGTTITADAAVTDSGGNQIGHVPANPAFWGFNPDGALIVPDDPSTASLPPGRVVHMVQPSDVGMAVSTANGNTGTIEGMDNAGIGGSTNDFIVDGGGTPFAVPGDSGSVAFNGNQLLGMVRMQIVQTVNGVQSPTNLAVLVQMSDLQAELNFGV